MREAGSSGNPMIMKMLSHADLFSDSITVYSLVPHEGGTRDNNFCMKLFHFYNSSILLLQYNHHY